MRKRRFTLLMIVFIGMIFSSGTMAQNCLDFDGTNDYCSGTGVSTSLTGITIEVWVKHNSIGNTIQRYVTVGSEVAVLRYDGVVFGNAHLLHFYVKKTDGTLYSIYTFTQPVVGEWIHVAGTYDGTDIKIYTNGELKENTSTGAGLYAPSGDVSLSKATEPLDGSMDEVRIWNYARSQIDL